MFIKLVDRKSGHCVASGNIDSTEIGRDEIATILDNSRLHLDDFGNVRNIFGEFTIYHLQNLIAVRESISA